MKEQIKIAAKLYECQETAKMFFKEEYPSKIKWYKDVIVNYQKKNNKDVLQSTLALCQLESVKENGMAIMMFMAATVDLIESDKI